MAIKVKTKKPYSRSDSLHLDPDDIIVGKNSRWQQFDEEHVERLVQSFEEHGQEEEIVVRRVHDNQVALVFGFNRHEAARRYNERHPDKPMMLRCRVIDCNEEEAFRKSIVENVDRLSRSVVDDAHAQRRLREDFGWSEERIAKLYGCSRGRTHLIKKVLLLPVETQMRVHRGELPLSAAISLADIPESERTEVLQQAERDSIESANHNAGNDAAEPQKPGETLSAAVKRHVRDRKIKNGGKQPRTLSEIVSFWKKIDSENPAVSSLAGLMVRFHEGSISDVEMRDSLELLS